ncbi:hypothetical protein BDW71DRAFT_210361 [Aspergillus fruticulosus]
MTAPQLQRELIFVRAADSIRLLLAVLLGYAVPAVVMAVPSSMTGKSVSYEFQQRAIVIWNVYPLLILGLLLILKAARPNMKKGMECPSLHLHPPPPKPNFAGLEFASPLVWL